MNGPERARQTHWVRPNHVSRQPKCWVFLDTEARLEVTAEGQTQRWRFAVTCHDHRDGAWPGWRAPQWRDHDDPAELWDYVTGLANVGTRLVLVAHKLDYDLRISDAFAQLARRGWAIDRIRLDSDQAQVRWRNGRRTIQAVDSLAFFPAPLAALADDLGMVKPEPDLHAGSDDEWRERCRADVEILRTAFRRMLDWLHDEDLGTWQPTGAGQSWSAWRHRFMDHRVLVDPDPELRALERAAVWCGRAECWRWGPAPDATTAEWDFESAYLRIMRDCDLPTECVARPTRWSPVDLERWLAEGAVLAEVEVTVTEPLVPTRGPHGILWPVGTFTTTLWDPELRLLAEAGAEVRYLRLAVYRRRPVLAAFARWLWPLVNDPDAEVDPIVRRVVKHWSRAIVGRFGVRYSTWEPFGAALDDRVALVPARDADSGESFRLLHAGDRVLREGAQVEGENAAPMVLGWIMSECRRRLWVTMADAGLENVLHVDTDGLLVTEAGAANLAARGHAGIRHKADYSAVEVLGPRQVVYGGRIRAPGVPRTARRISATEWTAPVWERLTTALRAQSLDVVRVTNRTISLVGTDHRRAHLPGGLTEPLEVAEL